METATSGPSSRPSGAAPNPWLYLEEITHRAVNEYTAMIAVVSRASQAVTDRASVEALEDVAERLRAAAAVSQSLRPASGAEPRRLDQDLESLCASLSASTLTGLGIRLTLVTEPIVLASRRSWQACLVIAELVRNAARHAFIHGRGGSILIRIGRRGNSIWCAVADDGSASEGAVAGRGTAILDALAADLGGTIVRHYAVAGSSVVLSMPVDTGSVRRRRQPVPPDPFAAHAR